MKRIFAFALITVFMLSLCACKGAERDDHSGHNHNHTTTAVQETTDGYADNTVTTEPYTQVEVTEDIQNTQDTTPEISDGVMGPLQQKHSDKIDAAYDAEYQTGATVEERMSITNKYTTEWEALAERYYNELLMYKGDTPVTANYATDEQLHEYIELYKSNFEMSFAESSEFYLDKIENDADQTAAQISYSQFCYNAKREYAMYLIGVYEELAEFNGQTL